LYERVDFGVLDRYKRQALIASAHPSRIASLKLRREGANGSEYRNSPKFSTC
jgi:hypothetical protein